MFHVFLGICSTFNQCVNGELLKGIHNSLTSLTSQSKGGESHTTQRAFYKGDFLGGLPTWYQPEGLANIISFNLLKSLYPITYDHENKVFIVHTKGLNSNCGKVEFKRGRQGFPYADLREEGAFNLLNTVRQEMEGFTSREVSEAKEAFALQHRTGNSSNEQLMRMVRSGNLRDTKPNLPQSMSDATKIFG